MSKTVPSEAFTRVIVSVCEFLEDWRKGDINLSTLAALDAQSIEEALTELGAAMDAAPSVEPDADRVERVSAAIEDALKSEDNGRIDVARAAIAAMPGGGEVKIKPLEWGGVDYDYAKTIVGSYSVYADGIDGDAGWYVSTDNRSTSIEVMEMHPTREGAHAAAQDDYERTIRSALGGSHDD